MKKYWYIILTSIFTLAIGLGLLQKQSDPYVRRLTFKNSSTGKTDPGLTDFYSTAKNLKQQQENQITKVSFLAVGDIMLSRNVALKTQISKKNNWPFLNLTELFNSVDFSFGNLETPIAKDKGTIGGHSLVFNSPKEYVAELVNTGFKIVNLANNHAMDQGQNGLNYTTEFLDDLNIKYVGTGKDLKQAWEPKIIEQEGIKICFIGASYASLNDNGKTTNNYVARIEDLENLKSSIASAKFKCDFTVVTMHAGTEYTRKPNQAQTTFAQNAVDFGADIVIGAHPHWIQTIEKYKDKYIFYSLGNFVFDQDFSQDTKEGLTLKITISKNSCHPERLVRHSFNDGESEGSLSISKQSDSSVALGMVNNGACTDEIQGQRNYAKLNQIELIPVIIENAQPRPTTSNETKKILEKIGQNKNTLY